MKKTYLKIALFCAVLVMFSSLAYASPNFFITTKDLVTEINYNEAAQYSLTIYNNNTFDDYYFLTAKDVKWSLQTDPLLDYFNGLYVPAKSKRTTKILLVAGSSVKPVKQNIGLLTTSKLTGEESLAVVEAKVFPKQVVYSADTSAELIVPYYVDPRKKISVQAVIKNNNEREFSNLELSLSGKSISRKISINLKPLEREMIDFTIEFDKLAAPGKDTLVLELRDGAKIIASDKKEVEIISYSDPFKREEVLYKGFLTEKTIITLFNDGNAVKEQVVYFGIKPFDAKVASANPKEGYDVQKNAFYWTIMLAPSERTTIVVEKNYWPLFVLIVALITFIIVNMIFRSPLRIKKIVSEVTEKEGGISQLKVMVRIKNRTRKPVRNVKLIERIPLVGMYVRDGETVKPTKTYKYKEGTVVEWHFPEIEPKEERIISYTIKSSLVIMGRMRLKPAVVRYGNRKTFSKAAHTSTKHRK